MRLPWTEVNALAPLEVAKALELPKESNGKRVRERRKFICPVCGGSNLHAWERVFFCFSGCGSKEYTNVDMASIVWNLPPIDALRELAAEFGIPIPVWNGRAMQRDRRAHPIQDRIGRRSEQEENLAALKSIPKPRHPSVVYRAIVDRLTLGPLGESYLSSARRGLDPDAAHHYGFRSVEGSGAWEQLSEFLLDSFRLEELAAAGFPTLSAAELQKLGRPKGTRMLHLPMGGLADLLLIPYRHRGEVVGIRFANLRPRETIEQRDEPKYLTLRAATPPVPFNADATPNPYLHIVEGEFNAYVLSMYGQAAWGLAGAGVWRQEWTPLLERATRVIAWYDADRAGNRGWERFQATVRERFGEEWIREVLYRMPVSKDPNQLHVDRQLRQKLAQAPWISRLQVAANGRQGMRA